MSEVLSEVTETPVETIEPVIEEKRFEFQPTDELDRPIGAPQVFKYRTTEELQEKLREQNVLLIRKLRSETRKNRLGVVENEEIPEDAQRYSSPIEFTPRELSNDERVDLSRRLLDPTTALEATSEFVEAAFGAKPSTIGEAIQSIQADNLALRAKIEADTFAATTPGYYICPENSEAIISWLVRYNLAPVRANFEKAYATLSNQGVLVQAPIKRHVEPVIEPEPTRQELPQTTPVVRIPTGLTRENTYDSGTAPAPGSDIVYEFVQNGQKRTLSGLQAVAAMPGEEYKRRLLTDKEFGKKVDALESAARKPRV